MAKAGTLTVFVDAVLNKSIDSELKKTTTVIESFGNVLVKFGKAAALSLAATGTAAAFAFKKSIDAASEAQQISAQLDAALRSTAGAAGIARTELDSWATALANSTAFEDDAISAAQALMLTFTKIGHDVFPQAMIAVANMATAMGTDLKSATIQVGKALNDPILGVSALGRAGVQFSEDQKKMIKSLVGWGETAQAQQIILKELETQFGGSAVAAAQTFGGQMDQLKNKFGNLGEAIGGIVVENNTLRVGMGLFGEVLSKVEGFVKDNKAALKSLVVEGFKGVISALGVTAQAIAAFIPWVNDITFAFVLLAKGFLWLEKISNAINPIAHLTGAFDEMNDEINDDLATLKKWENSLAGQEQGLNKLSKQFTDLADELAKVNGGMDRTTESTDKATMATKTYAAATESAVKASSGFSESQKRLLENTIATNQELERTAGLMAGQKIGARPISEQTIKPIREQKIMPDKDIQVQVQREAQQEREAQQKSADAAHLARLGEKADALAQSLWALVNFAMAGAQQFIVSMGAAFAAFLDWAWEKIFSEAMPESIKQITGILFQGISLLTDFSAKQFQDNAEKFARDVKHAFESLPLALEILIQNMPALVRIVAVGIGRMFAGLFEMLVNAIIDLINLIPGIELDKVDFTPFNSNIAGAEQPTITAFHSGGLVPGSSNTQVPALLKGGEMVLTRAQQAQMQGASNVTVNVVAAENPAETADRVLVALRTLQFRGRIRAVV